MYGFPIKEASIIGVVIHGGRLSFVGPNLTDHRYLNGGWARYNSHLENHLVQLSSMLSKSKKSSVENKIILSSKLFNLALQSEIDETRFITLISAIESLLLTEGDRDYLGLKLAEKTAFLIWDDKDRRTALYKKMKALYSTRSKIVHGKVIFVAEHDVRTLKDIYIALLKKLLSLETGIKDEKTFDDYINTRKFS